MLCMVKKCKTCKERKTLFKLGIKTKLYVIKIFDNDLVAILKSKVTLTLNKPEYVVISLNKPTFISDLSKVLM